MAKGGLWFHDSAAGATTNEICEALPPFRLSSTSASGDSSSSSSNISTSGDYKSSLFYTFAVEWTEDRFRSDLLRKRVHKRRFWRSCLRRSLVPRQCSSTVCGYMRTYGVTSFSFPAKQRLFPWHTISALAPLGRKGHILTHAVFSLMLPLLLLVMIMVKMVRGRPAVLRNHQLEHIAGRRVMAVRRG